MGGGGGGSGVFSGGFVVGMGWWAVDGRAAGGEQGVTVGVLGSGLLGGGGGVL